MGSPQLGLGLPAPLCHVTPCPLLASLASCALPAWRREDPTGATPCRLPVQVSGRERLLTYEQYGEAGGLEDMRRMEREAEGGVGPMNLAEAEAIWEQILAAAGHGPGHP